MQDTLSTCLYAALTYNPAINARGDDLSDTSELQASILADGIGQPLLVRPQPKSRARNSRYEIVEGSRRYRAIGALIAAGKWDPENPVPIFIRQLSDAAALELSLATSLTRLPLGPAAEAEAFTALSRAGRSDDDIALAFGIPQRRVAQRLALGRLYPPILDRLRSGDLDLDTAQAFTLSPDVKRQKRVWQELVKDGAFFTSRRVTMMLAGEAARGDSREARLVGEERYTEAGGAIRRDLFGDEVWFEDAALLTRLFDERLKEIEQGLIADGWSFVIVETDSRSGKTGGWDSLAPRATPAPKDAKRLKAIAREIARTDRDDLNFDATGGLERLEAERAAIEGGLFTAEQRAASGCVVAFTWAGDLAIAYGKVRPGRRSSPSPLAGEGGVPGPDPGAPGEGAQTAPPQEEADLSGAVLADLSHVMAGVLQLALIDRPGQALRLLLATLIHRRSAHDAPFRIETRSWSGPSAAHESCVARRRHTLAPFEGKDFAAILDMLDFLSEIDLAGLLAVFLADALDWSAHPGAAGGALIQRLDPDCVPWFIADEAFFTRLKRGQLVDALADIDQSLAQARANRKKPELVALCVEKLRGSGWLPVPLRGPSYAGPGSAAWADAHTLPQAAE